MAPKYLVNIGDERLFFDDDRQPVELDGDGDVRDPDVPLPIWSVEEEEATSREWDMALGNYSSEARGAAKIRILGSESPQD